MITETFATIRIFSESISRDQISEILGIEANGGYDKDSSAKARTKREFNYWCWSTDRAIDSGDNLKHVEKLIKKFEPLSTQLEQLRMQGCKTDISSFVVTTGQGGPTLELETMASLTNLGLPIWWDIYFEENET